MKFNFSIQTEKDLFWFQNFLIEWMVIGSLLIGIGSTLLALITQASYLNLMLIISGLLSTLLIMIKLGKIQLSGYSYLIALSIIFCIQTILVKANPNLFFLVIIIIVAAIITNLTFTTFLFISYFTFTIVLTLIGIFSWEPEFDPVTGIQFATASSVILPLLSIAYSLSIVIHIILIGTIKNQAISQAKLDITLQNIDEGVITTDLANQIIFVNHNAEKIIGQSQAQLLGKDLGKLMRITSCNETSFNSITLPKDYYPNDCIMHISDEKKYLIELKTALLRDKDGKDFGMLTIFRDVMEIRKTEAEMHKRERFESIGLLAGGIAHDFNNLLTSILGNVSLLHIDIPEKSEQFSQIVEIEKATLRATELTRQLLTFAKGGSPIKQLCSITQLIQETADFIIHGKSTKIIYQLSPELWSVDIDKGQISQVIHNIVLNAVQAMNNKGTIHIIADNLQINEKSTIGLVKGDYIRILIRDEGPGIPENIQPKIFVPYVTTKTDGNGLGLSIAYSIIQKHGGGINFESKPNKGTTFYIYLPAFPGKSPVDIKKDSILKTMIPEGLNVIVLEDEPSIIALLTNMLGQLKAKFEIYSDGYQVIEKYQDAFQMHHPYDLVILDLTVPGSIGGGDVIVQLKELDPNVCAIVSSGYSDEEIMSKYKSYGFKGVLAKPYTFEKLKMILANIFTKST